MLRLFQIMFAPPPMPAVDLPYMTARMEATIRHGLGQIYEAVYYRGVWDGFVAGLLVALLFVPAIRERASKGVSNVVKIL